MSKIGQAFNLEIWKKGLLSDVVVDSALVSMYGKIGAIPEAEAVFNSKLIQRNSVTWNAMISAYVEHGYAEKALELYCKMEVGLLDEITLVCVLQSCSEMSNLCLCEELHFSIVSTGLDITSNTLMNTLVNAYGCCASQQNALAVFSSMSKPDSVSWNAYVAGYAHHGNSLGCFRVFERMQFAGVKADCVTMLFLLYACSHDGKVDEGLECFGLIMACFGPCPDLQHYIAMLDLLGRNGDFQKIEHALLRAEMPMQTDVSVWLCVLGTCRTHRNMELGNRAFANAVNLKPDNASAYLLLSNLYVDCCYDEVTDDGWSGQMILQ
jgi:pentatricopeptide repeat protein